MSWLTDPDTTQEELEANEEIARQTQREIEELWRKHDEGELYDDEETYDAP